MKEELVKPFIGKHICFLRQDSPDKRFYNYGRVEKVEDGFIVINYRGRLQVYSLETVLSIREEEDKEVGK